MIPAAQDASFEEVRRGRLSYPGDVPARTSRFGSAVLILLAAGVLAADVGILAASSDTPRSKERAAVSCPSLGNTRLFGDARDRCATAATALPVGDVPASELPCLVSPGKATFTRSKHSVSVSMRGPGDAPRGQKFCDSFSGAGTTLYFDSNTLRLNNPAFPDDYDRRFPIGIVIDRTQPDCIPARACRK